MLIAPSVLVLVQRLRTGTRRPVEYGDTFELWDGVHMIAEFPTVLMLDLFAGLVANIEVNDRVRQGMPAKRKPLAVVSPEQQKERQNARRKRS